MQVWDWLDPVRDWPALKTSINIDKIAGAGLAESGSVERTTLARWSLLLCLTSAACVGNIGDSDPEANGAQGGPNAPGSAPLDAAPARLHHLSARQYVNTVRDLLGVADASPVLVDDEGDVPSMLLAETRLKLPARLRIQSVGGSNTASRTPAARAIAAVVTNITATRTNATISQSQRGPSA